jgi:hypothetical protein
MIAQRMATHQGIAARAADPSLPTISLHRMTVARFQRHFHADPAMTVTDGRHGHPAKLRGAALVLLDTRCCAEWTIPTDAPLNTRYFP